MIEGSDPYLWLMDPDGPKTYGSYGSGTLPVSLKKFRTGTCVVCMMVRSLSCPKPGPILPRIPAVPNSKRGAIIRWSSGKAACSTCCATFCRVSLFSSQANQSSTRRFNGKNCTRYKNMRGAKSFNFKPTQHFKWGSNIPTNNFRQEQHENYDWKHQSWHIATRVCLVPVIGHETLQSVQRTSVYRVSVSTSYYTPPGVENVFRSITAGLAKVDENLMDESRGVQQT